MNTIFFLKIGEVNIRDKIIPCEQRSFFCFYIQVSMPLTKESHLFESSINNQKKTLGSIPFYFFFENEGKKKKIHLFFINVN